MAESKENDGDKGSESNIKDLPEKIWELRAEMDALYAEGINYHHPRALHIAYALALWRIGYSAEGIEKTNEWSKYNQDMKIAQYHLARANAFMNVDENKKAMIELQNALKCCTDENDMDKDDEVQTRLLMAVTYNKMNKLDLGKRECEFILNLVGKDKHEGTLKMYAAILQRMKKYKK